MPLLRPIVSESTCLKDWDYNILVYDFSFCLTAIQLLRLGESLSQSSTANTNKYILQHLFLTKKKSFAVFQMNYQTKGQNVGWVWEKGFSPCPLLLLDRASAALVSPTGVNPACFVADRRKCLSHASLAGAGSSVFGGRPWCPGSFIAGQLWADKEIRGQWLGKQAVARCNNGPWGSSLPSTSNPH